MHIRRINYEKSAKGNDEQGQAIDISGDVLLFGFAPFLFLLKKGTIVSFCAHVKVCARAWINQGTPSNTRLSIASAFAAINNDQTENSSLVSNGRR